jgi:hypothetical protein
VFGAETGEEWPLAVGTAVAVVAAAPEWPPVVRGAPGLAAPVVAAQGALQDVRVEGGGAIGAGIAISCGAAPSLRRVGVDGGGTFDPGGAVTGGLSTGVAVSGACGARLQSVDVSRVAGPALAIDPAAAATVDVLGGSYRASTVGIRIRGGKVTIAPDPDTAASVVVSGNAREGIVIGPTALAVDVKVEGASIATNGGAGVIAQVLPSASRLRVARCDVTGNGAGTPAVYGSGSGRTAGGLLFALNGIAGFEFEGNRVWANASDQLGFESNASWSIAPLTLACGAGSNVFKCLPSSVTCLDGGPCAVAVAGAGSVDASYNAWPNTPASYHVTLSVTGAASPFVCATPPEPFCPAP